MSRTTRSSRKAQGRTGAGTGRPLTLVFGLSLTAGLGVVAVDSRTVEAGGHQSRERHLVTQAPPHFRDALFYVPNDREATIAFWNERRALHLQQAPADRTPPESPYDRFMRFGYDETSSRDHQSALINVRRALAERPGDDFATRAVRNVRTNLQR